MHRCFRANPLLACGSALQTPPFAAIRPEHFRPPSTAPWPITWRQSRRSRPRRGAPSFANTIAALEPQRPAPSGLAVFRALAGAHTNDASLAFEREMSPRLAAHRNRIHFMAASMPGSRRCGTAAADLGAFARAGARAGALRRDVPPRRRRPRRCRQAAASPRSASGSRARHRVQPERARRRAAYALVLETEEDLAGLGAALRARRTRGGARARPRRQARHHAGAFERRAVPAVLDAAGPAGEGFLGLDRPRRRRRGDRQQGHHRRDGARCAPSGRGCSAIRHSPIIGSTTPWPRRRRRCAALLERVWTPARDRAAGRPRRAAGADPGGGRQFRPRAVGLALLRREAAQGALRHRCGARSRPISRSTR